MFGLNYVPGAILGKAKRKAPRSDSSVDNKIKIKSSKTLSRNRMRGTHGWHMIVINARCFVVFASHGLFCPTQSGIGVLMKRITKTTAAILPNLLTILNQNKCINSVMFIVSTIVSIVKEICIKGFENMYLKISFFFLFLKTAFVALKCPA